MSDSINQNSAEIANDTKSKIIDIIRAELENNEKDIKICEEKLENLKIKNLRLEKELNLYV